MGEARRVASPRVESVARAPSGNGTLKEQRGWLDDDPIPRVLDAGALRPAKDALEPGRLQVELGEISDALDACVEGAAQREDPSLLRGQLRYELSVRSSGEVVGVNVRGNSRLRALGVQACARVTLFGHAFPAFQGTPIRVEGIYEL